ncbi:MAG: caspase family protein [Bacteroidia bacterium]|nr:caspase family protein [Bacteroidia bacterium]
MKECIMVFCLMLCGSIITLGGTCKKGNCYSGKGQYAFESGAVYAGQFKNGKMHGYGIYRSKSRTRYEGEWFYGRRHGKGKLYFSNGDIYHGDFGSNKMEGYGKISYSNGDNYLGDWKNNKANGNGSYTFSDGDKYTGKFVVGKFHGKGIMKYANGAIYNGYWSENKKHGNGIFTAVNGRKKSGKWAYGRYLGSQESESLPFVSIKPNKSKTNTQSSKPPSTKITHTQLNRSSSVREGAYTFSDGTQYVGEMVNGLPNGKGKVYFNNGNRYEGGWKHHTQSGDGIMYFQDGRVLSARWSDGKLIRAYSDSRSSTTEKEGPYGDVKVWAVLVGISSYTTMPALRYTDDDAYRMYAFLKSPEGGAVPDEQIKILIDRGANKKSINKAITEIFGRADENDVVFFFYSGHGLAQAFVPVDFDGYNNLILYRDVVAALDRSKAKNKICIADACYSGGLNEVKSGDKYPQLNFYNAFKETKPGTALFMSSHSQEYSLEDHGLRSGIFSHYLIKALKGEADYDRNQIVTIEEAHDYVYKNVRRYTQQKQSPILTGNYDPKIPLASLR